MNFCRICGVYKEKKHFYRKNATVCRPCANKETTLWQKNNPEAVKRIKRRVKLKEKYGLSEDQYQEMLSKQNNLCAICSKPHTRRNFNVDHCHSTGKIRGLLCDKCNLGIGLFNDDPNLLDKIKEYLK